MNGFDSQNENSGKFTPRNEHFPEIIEYTITVMSKFLHVGRGKEIEIINKNKLTAGSKLANDIITGFLSNNNRVFNNLDNAILIKQAFSRAGDKYVIPGGTIKGAVRARLEESLNNTCHIVTDTSSGQNKKSEYSKKYNRTFDPNEQGRSKDFSEDSFNKGEICLVCDLFGDMGLASRVSFSDAILTSDPNSYVVSEKIGNEDFGTKKKGEEYELVKKGAVFEGFIVIRGNGIDKGAVYYGMGIRCENDEVKYMDILLGRFKYRNQNFGRVRFKIKNNSDVCKNIKDFVSKYRPKK